MKILLIIAILSSHQLKYKSVYEFDNWADCQKMSAGVTRYLKHNTMAMCATEVPVYGTKP